MRLRFAFVLCVLASSAAAHGANVISVTGPSPFGFANQAVLVEGWSQAATYSNVIITMPLRDDSAGGPISGVEGTVYLTNKIGPGTTVANEVAPPVSISGLTASFTTRTVFSGLSLPPGNYYVVWVPTNTDPLSMSPEGSSTPTVTTGTGVAASGADASLTPAVYPPATTFSLNAPGNLFVDVSGDLVSVAPLVEVPTLGPFGFGVLLLGLAAAALFLLRQQGS